MMKKRFYVVLYLLFAILPSSYGLGSDEEDEMELDEKANNKSSKSSVLGKRRLANSEAAPLKVQIVPTEVAPGVVDDNNAPASNRALPVDLKGEALQQSNLQEQHYMQGMKFANGENGVVHDYVKALNHFNQALMNGGEHLTTQQKAEAYYYRGSIYFTGGHGVDRNYVEACVNLKQGLAEGQHLTGARRARFRLGLIYLAGGNGVDINHVEALEHFNNVLMNEGEYLILSNRAMVHFYLGLIYCDGRNGVDRNYVEASANFKQALEGQELIQPHRATVHLRLGNIYYNGGNGIDRNFAKACSHLRQALEGQDLSPPNRAEAYFSLGYIYYHGGNGVDQNYAEACVNLEQALVAEGQDLSQPYRAAASFILGVIYYNGGIGVDQNPVKALEFFNQALVDGGEHLPEYNRNIAHNAINRAQQPQQQPRWSPEEWKSTFLSLRDVYFLSLKDVCKYALEYRTYSNSQKRRVMKDVSFPEQTNPSSLYNPDSAEDFYQEEIDFLSEIIKSIKSLGYANNSSSIKYLKCMKILGFYNIMASHEIAHTSTIAARSSNLLFHGLDLGKYNFGLSLVIHAEENDAYIEERIWAAYNTLKSVWVEIVEIDDPNHKKLMMKCFVQEALESCTLCSEGSQKLIDAWFQQNKLYIESGDLYKKFTETYIIEKPIFDVVAELYNALKTKLTLSDDDFCRYKNNHESFTKKVHEAAGDTISFDGTEMPIFFFKELLADLNQKLEKKENDILEGAKDDIVNAFATYLLGKVASDGMIDEEQINKVLDSLGATIKI